ncbi:MAG: PPC domain-containing protein [Cyanobacteria bacterium J06635_1]
MQSLKLALSGALSLGCLVALSPTSLAQNTAILSEQGQLEANDNRLDDNSLYDLYRFTGEAGQQVTITLSSPDFDAYLFLVDPDGNKLAENDDIDGSTDASLTVNLPVSGEYMIVANSYDAAGFGAYTVTVTAAPTDPIATEPDPEATSETTPEPNPEPSPEIEAEAETVAETEGEVDPALLVGEWSAPGECDRSRYVFTQDGDYLWMRNLDSSWQTAYKGIYGPLSPEKITEFGITSPGAIYVGDHPNAGSYTIEILALNEQQYDGFWNVQLSEGLSFDNPDDAYFSYERCPAR